MLLKNFIRTLKNKIYNVYIDKLDDIINKYNNTYHRTIEMKPINFNSNTYIDFNKENYKDGLKFKVGNHVRIWKYKNIFAKVYDPNWSEEDFVIQKVKNTMSWTYVNSDLKDEEIVWTFYEKKLLKPNQKEFSIEKVIKIKVDKLYVE